MFPLPIALAVALTIKTQLMKIFIQIYLKHRCVLNTSISQLRPRLL